MDLENIALVLFFLFLIVFVIVKRKKIKMQKLLFPVFYLLLYRTRWGIKSMHRAAKKHPKLLKWFGYAAIVIGFLGMVFLCYNLIFHLVKFFIEPSAPALALVVPFKMKGAFYIPFFYWIISIVILAVVHEFSHGMMAALARIRIKSSGFAFMSLLIPIIPAAFVEPDEKELLKKKRSEQLSVLAAGPFANILLGFLIFGLILLFSFPITNSLYDFSGVEVYDFMEVNNTPSPMELLGVGKGEVIEIIENKPVQNITHMLEILDSLKPGQNISFITSESEYTIVLAANPLNKSRPYLGIYLGPHFKVKEKFNNVPGRFFTGLVSWINGKWISRSLQVQQGLLSWLFLLNVGIGLFNLIPIGPIDGGKMFYLAMLKFFKKKKALKISGIVSTLFLLVILFNLFVGFVL